MVHGRAGADGVASTVSLVRDGAAVIVIDPGMVRDRWEILDALSSSGVDPTAVTDVVLTHHHPDHTVNIALFPEARVHDHWAIYHRDTWTDRAADGFLLSPSVRLIATPGHTRQDITILAGTPDGIVAFTHLWWSAEGPDEDPLAEDMQALHASRRRVLQVADRVVPGHGSPFAPGSTTPR
ncbi:MAG: MBL fold metallo-hydrolase [Chloroflexi bacterium]|nr:MAG: MBL fold metallo-hydrolase [Chloroflexota bacterium]